MPSLGNLRPGPGAGAPLGLGVLPRGQGHSGQLWVCLAQLGLLSALPGELTEAPGSKSSGPHVGRCTAVTRTHPEGRCQEPQAHAKKPERIVCLPGQPERLVETEGAMSPDALGRKSWYHFCGPSHVAQLPWGPEPCDQTPRPAGSRAGALPAQVSNGLVPQVVCRQGQVGQSTAFLDMSRAPRGPNRVAHLPSLLPADAPTPSGPKGSRAPINLEIRRKHLSRCGSHSARGGVKIGSQLGLEDPPGESIRGP